MMEPDGPNRENFMRASLAQWGVLACGLLSVAVVGLSITRASGSSHSAAAPVPHVARVVPAAAPAAGPKVAPAPADEPFVIKRILSIAGPIPYGEWHWDDANVPAGPLVITVDLDARVLSAFRAGYEIGATAVLLGTQEKPTPTGVFPITQKDANHISNLYDAPMPYMMRLTNDGVTIHGTNVERRYASHGCVGVPAPFAKKLFGVAKLGDRVIITRGKSAKLGDALS